MVATDLGLALVRLALGAVFVAHGWNHIFGGGGIPGTAQWFERLGMRYGWIQAWTASLTELGGGVLVLAGLATPLACAGIVGTMIVALVTNHLRNGFFIFRPGEGYEYVATLALVAAGLGCVGAGGWSLDNALGWFDPPGWWGLGIVAVGGVGGSAVVLAVLWRPGRSGEPHDGGN